jgi:multisubunit Na+/H+ antiporter MnhE subunit
MRWLLIVLLVSLAALLIAAFGVARHILLQRDRLRPSPVSHPASSTAPAPETAAITEVETEV